MLTNEKSSGQNLFQPLRMPDPQAPSQAAVDARPSLEELFAEEEGPLLRFCTGISGRRDIAEELVQEGFLRLHSHWSEVKNPRAWIYRCVRNLALNSLRDSAKEQSSGEVPEHSAPEPLPTELLSRLEACGHLRMLVAEMTPKDRELLALKYNDHLGYAEISRRTGLGIGNVGYRLHHLLKSLAESLQQLGIDSPLG